MTIKSSGRNLEGLASTKKHSLFPPLFLFLSDTQKTYIADAPSDGAFLAGRRRLISLAFYAQIHYVISADSAVVHDDVCKVRWQFFKTSYSEIFLNSNIQINDKKNFVTHPKPRERRHSTVKFFFFFLINKILHSMCGCEKCHARVNANKIDDDKAPRERQVRRLYMWKGRSAVRRINWIASEARLWRYLFHFETLLVTLAAARGRQIASLVVNVHRGGHLRILIFSTSQSCGHRRGTDCRAPRGFFARNSGTYSMRPLTAGSTSSRNQCRTTRALFYYHCSPSPLPVINKTLYNC